MGSGFAAVQSTRHQLVRFWREASLFVLVQLLVFAALLAATRGEEDRYLEGIYGKHALLEATEGSPRLMLIGGSNCALGQFTRPVAEPLGLQPVNLGLHVRTGLLYILREAEAAAQPGDVVVLAPEYQHFTSHTANAILLELLDHRPAGFGLLAPAHLVTIGEHGLIYLGGLSRRAGRQFGAGTPGKPPFTPGSFNAEGDVVGHFGLEPGRPVEDVPFRLDDFDSRHLDRTIQRINRFGERIEAKGAQAFVYLPPIAEYHYERSLDDITPILERVERDLAVPLLNSQADIPWPTELFWDMPYHLRADGMARRSTVLLELLQEKLGVRP